MDKTGVAETARDIWTQALAKPIDEDSDYFVLGGHSFQALTIIAKLDVALGTRIPLVTIFDAPRFGDFVECVIAHLGLAAST
jgi:hypothetical protein